MMVVEMNVPDLPGWMALPVAADLLGVKRQRVFQMVQEKKLTSVHKIPGTKARPMGYVVSVKEIDKLLEEQKAADEKRAATEDAARAKTAAAEAVAVPA